MTYVSFTEYTLLTYAPLAPYGFLCVDHPLKIYPFLFKGALGSCIDSPSINLYSDGISPLPPFK